MKDKLEARKAMLKSLKKEMGSMMGEGRGDLSEMLGKKKMKVTVASDSEKGLKEGLSKAEEIMNKKVGSEPEMESKEEVSSEHSCPECEDLGCEMCDEESEESEEMEESSEEPEQSLEELKSQIKMLKKQLSSKEE